MIQLSLQLIFSIPRILFFLPLVFFLSALPANAQKEDSRYEVPRNIHASGYFSEKFLRGPHHKIQDKVVSYNGFTNHFRINSRFGRFKATGNGMVLVRIKEIEAIARLKKMKDSDKFLDGLKSSGGTLLESTKNLILHPVDTIEGFPSGLYNIFADIGVIAKKVLKREATLAQATVKAGDALVGFSRNKRELAYQIGVNRFSDNKILHEHLNSVAWATTGGTFIIDFGKMAVSGPAGNVLTGISATRTMDRMMRDNTNPGLQRINETTLEKMEIKDSSVKWFIGNKKLTPRHQTSIVKSLASLSNAKNREAFLNLISFKTRSLDDANMYQAVAAMIAAYNETQDTITEIATSDKIVMFRNEKGSYVLTYPIDNFFWTEETAKKTQKVLGRLHSKNKKELWISGKFSDLAAKNLNDLGWVLHDQAYGKLGIKNPY